MDPSNYKVPKRQPINYGPKIKPKTLVIKPMEAATKPVGSSQLHTQKPQAKPIQPTNKPIQQAPKPYLAPPVMHQINHQPSLRPEAVFTAPVKAKKKRKTRRILKKTLIVVAVIALLGLLVGGGYFGYKKYQDSKKPAEASNSKTLGVSSGSSSLLNTASNLIMDADFIVYGIKEGSLFATSRADYAKDNSAPMINVIGKSTYPNDNRQVVINQQKVSSDFSTDPAGLKKMADSIGSNIPVTTKNGTSYIITGNATGLTAIGATLISVRTSASLALTEWQQIFNDLQPVQI